MKEQTSTQTMQWQLNKIKINLSRFLVLIFFLLLNCSPPTLRSERSKCKVNLKTDVGIEGQRNPSLENDLCNMFNIYNFYNGKNINSDNGLLLQCLLYYDNLNHCEKKSKYIPAIY